MIQIFLTKREKSQLTRFTKLTKVWNSRLWLITYNRDNDVYTLYQEYCFDNKEARRLRICEVDEPLVYDEIY